MTDPRPATTDAPDGERTSLTPATTAAELLLIAWAALPEPEQEDAYALLTRARIERIAGDESDAERFIRSLARVAQEVGGDLSPDSYKETQQRLVADGEDIATINQVIKHFQTWSRAKEALSLSDVTTVRRVQARFDSRRLGKVWRYDDQTLRDTLAACVAHYGRVPLLAEFDHWREGQLQAARARGQRTPQMPSPTPYRKRWGSWEGALLAHGYTPEQVAARLEQGEIIRGGASRPPLKVVS